MKTSFAKCGAAPGALVVVWLTATSCLGPRSDPSTFFVLSATVAPAAEDPVPVTLGLGPVTLPGYLTRSEIATRVSDNQLAYAETARWAEPLTDSVIRSLRENLVRLLRPERVILHPWYLSEGVDYEIAIDIARLESDTTLRSATLIATWSVNRVDGTAHTERGQSRITEDVTAAGTEASVAALSRAVARLSEEVATGVRRASQASSGH
jgi:uncharacterized lipoprotein YmbA